LALFAAATAAAQAFGRFGYSDEFPVAGFEFDRTGFRVRHERADRFYFEEPSRIWSSLTTTEFGQTFGLSGVGRSPFKARIDLTAPGFSLYFRNGVGFRLNSTSAPYLTWKEGSVGANVPTPALKWILVSFRDDQPPLLISLLGSPAPFKVSGRPGDWRLRTEGLYAGWVRVAAPIGTTSQATNSATALGQLKERVLPLAPYLSDAPPQLEKVDIAEDPTSVTATWTFDRPYAVVPVPALLANLGGYGLKLDSPTIRLDSSDPEGPTSILKERTLRIRFPIRRMPTGRSLALGAPTLTPIGTVSPIDPASVVELALANLPACRDRLTKETAEQALAKYLQDANYALEPHTNQRLPFEPNGAGLDLAAAHALLMQSTITTVRATSEPNSLLTSLMLRRDWRTWRLWTADLSVSRRAGALGALAAALCPEPKRRLDGAMLEAGLAAVPGLRVWKSRNGQAPGPAPSPTALEGLRRALFLYSNRTETDESYVRSLLSDVRVYGDVALRAEWKEGSIAVTWLALDTKPMSIMLASAYPLSVSASANLASSSADDALGFTVIRCVPSDAGRCELLLKTPEWAVPLPKYVEPPRFEGTLLQVLLEGRR